jgi:hypothetical protein
MNQFFDIETLPCLDPKYVAELRAASDKEMQAAIDAIAAPGNYKDPVTIEKWMQTEGAKKEAAIRAGAEASIDEAHRKTSFDGAIGHICVIAGAFEDDAPQAFYSPDKPADQAEADVLREYFAYLSDHYRAATSRKPRFIGHNISGFDLRFLFQRAVVLGVKPPPFIPFHAKPWDDVIFDTMTYFAGVGKSIKLDTLCKALGLPGKSSMDGSKVYDAYLDGRIEDIAIYCRDEDVVQTRQVYHRLQFMPVPMPEVFEPEPDFF